MKTKSFSQFKIIIKVFLGCYLNLCHMSTVILIFVILFFYSKEGTRAERVNLLSTTIVGFNVLLPD